MTRKQCMALFMVSISLFLVAGVLLLDAIWTADLPRALRLVQTGGVFAGFGFVTGMFGLMTWPTG